MRVKVFKPKAAIRSVEAKIKCISVNDQTPGYFASEFKSESQKAYFLARKYASKSKLLRTIVTCHGHKLLSPDQVKVVHKAISKIKLDNLK